MTSWKFVKKWVCSRIESCMILVSSDWGKRSSLSLCVLILEQACNLLQSPLQRSVREVEDVSRNNCFDSISFFSWTVQQGFGRKIASETPHWIVLFSMLVFCLGLSIFWVIALKLCATWHSSFSCLFLRAGHLSLQGVAVLQAVLPLMSTSRIWGCAWFLLNLTWCAGGPHPEVKSKYIFLVPLDGARIEGDKCVG